MKPGVIRSADPSFYCSLRRFAEEMRNNPARAERILWDRLKNKQLGIKFRSQHIIFKYIADFCSIEKALIIEIDGETHKEQINYDEDRSTVLENCGYKVIRFTNVEVLNNLDEVLNQIRNHIN